MRTDDCRQLAATARTFAELPDAIVYGSPKLTVDAPVVWERDITFFVACYNEEGDILGTFASIREAMARFDWTWEIIVIDDASTDRSVELIKRYMGAHSELPIMLVVRQQNKGLGQNFIDAAFLGKGKYFKLVCGDNVDDSAQLASILSHLGEADMLLPYHSHTQNRTLFRRAVSRVYTFIVNLISGYRLHYYNGCGVHLRYNVMRWNSNCYGFDFQADLVTRLLDQGKTYVEIPTVAGERSAGQSTALAGKNFVSAAVFFLNLFMRRLANKPAKKRT
jgi:glycosyltransferase involved in cell wall biosynthesis